MNRGELRQLVLYWLDDLDAGYFTPPQVNLWLNNALVECQKQLLDCGEYWYLKCATTNLVQDEPCYTLPSDFLKANRIQIKISGTNVQSNIWSVVFNATLQESGQYQYGDGQPCMVTIGKDCLILNPPPDRSYPLKLDYSYKVAPMEDDLNVPDVPLQYHEYIALLAARDGFSKDERDPSIMFKEKFDSYVTMMKRDQIQRNRAQPRRVIKTFGDGISSGNAFGW